MPVKIAGFKTDADWLVLGALLKRSPQDRSLWVRAFDEFHYARINTRYLQPIESIERHDTQTGEGFAIAALFCSLVEFLETTERGLKYKFSNPDPAQYEYKDSGQKFKDFIGNREPFKSLIPSRLATSFYEDVRCGLVHEAQTKGTWVLSTAASNGALIDDSGPHRRLFRQALIPALRAYLDDYKTRLQTTPITQEAFIRKWAFLCNP